MRRLIVNADDFGLTAGVNRAIGESHEHGIVTSATLMANGAAFDDAVRLAAGHKLSVGCHVVLVDGSPVLSPTEVPSLLEDGVRFYSSLGAFARRALTGRIREEEMEAETTAQIRKLQAAGIAVSHVDTHKHAHIFPRVLKPVVLAAKACGIEAIRNPFEYSGTTDWWKRPDLWLRELEIGLLRVFQSSFKHVVSQSGLCTTDGAVGIAATGFVDERLLREAIVRLPEGTWELVCHPGYNDPDLAGIKTRLRESRESELALLTSASTRQLLQNQGLVPISYAFLKPFGHGT